MKRFAMTIAVLITLAPALIFSNSIIFTDFIIILIAIWLGWVLTEFYIGITRPFQGTEPKQPLLMISRMFWLFFAVYSWVDTRYHWSTAEFPSWFLALLLALCSAGLLIRIWAVIHLGKSFSYDVKKPESRKFIKTGPYRFIRHPAYMGILILGSVPGLILGSIPGFIGMLLSALVPVIIRAKAEDELLEAEFGEDYMKYKQSTFGLIPFFY